MTRQDSPRDRPSGSVDRMAATVLQLPPRGYYLAHEVGRLVGVSGDRIGQWARRGYIRPSVAKGRPNVYSYQDVAEAMVVHELVLHEVDFPIIKAAIGRARKQSGSEWPLTNARLFVPEGGGTVVIETESDGYREDAKNLHAVLDLPMQRVVSWLQRGGWAARDLPHLEHIEVDPDRLSGRPVVRGTRVPAEDAGRLAQQEDGVRILRREYGLTEAQIADAALWWETVERYEAA